MSARASCLERFADLRFPPDPPLEPDVVVRSESLSTLVGGGGGGGWADTSTLISRMRVISPTVCVDFRPTACAVGAGACTPSSILDTNDLVASLWVRFLES